MSQVQNAQNQINFLPQSFVLKQARHKRVYREAALVLVVMGCLAAWWAVRSHREASLREYAAALQAQVHAAEVQHNEMTRLRTEHQQLTHQVRIRHELAQPITPTQLLDQLGAALPRSVAIGNLSVIAQRPTPSIRSASAKAKGKTDKTTTAPPPSGPDRLRIEMQALAPDDMTVAQTVAALSDHPLFSDVKLHYSRAADANGRGHGIGRVFQLSMDVNLNRRFSWERPKTASAQRADQPQTLTRGVTLAN